jgi:hypothetical protein
MFPDAFLANYALHADFAKPSKFLVLIYQPDNLISGGLFSGLIGQTYLKKIGKGINTAGLSLQCEQASLPGYQINTMEQKVFGSPFTVAATPVFEPLQLTFICAGDMWERKFFDDWMEFILPKGTQRKDTTTSYTEKFEESVLNANHVPISHERRPAGTAKYRDDYIGTIQVIQFHDTGVPSARFTFEECFPVALASQPLNWGDADVHRLNITFHYRTWNLEKNLLKQIYDKFIPDAAGGAPSSSVKGNLDQRVRFGAPSGR